MKIVLDYNPPNWNSYINMERGNYHTANKLKQEEKKIVKYSTIGKQYKGKYPVRLNVTKHFKDHRQDLDNLRMKGLLDGLVTNGVIKNDNLNHIQEINIKAVIDGKEYLEIEIQEL